MIRFVEPQFLWLLLMLPIVWAMSRKLRMISPVRRYTIVGVRTLVLLLIVFALARVQWERRSSDLSVFFLVDRSDSIPQAELAFQSDSIRELSEKSTTKDETGVIVFGSSPSIETPSSAPFDFEGKFLSIVEGERTDVAAAMRLALAAFPADRTKRMVLLSDGNENSGSALEVARVAKNSGIPVDVVPVEYDTPNDVRVEKIVTPRNIAKDAPFDIRVHLTAEESTKGLLRIFEDGELIIEDEVTVNPGRNAPLTLTRRLQDGGFHTYTATVEAAGDYRPQNNKGNSFTYLRSEPRVLLIEGGDLESVRYLVGALKAENIDVDFGDPAKLPIGLEELQRYDSIILSNVPADNLSQAQMRMIERGVHDLGIGLIMIGGENSFGAGGYIDTPIETALPVSMDIKQKKMLPNGALVICMHTCEMPNGNDWAREIALASLNVLSAQDYFGINFVGRSNSGVNYGYGEQWLWDPPVQMVGGKKYMRTQIKGVQPMDAQAFDGMLRMAADELVKVKAQTKHIVVVSDGDPAAPNQSTVAKIRANGITVSGVGIFPHDPSTVQNLQQMALWGGGSYYYPKTAQELPRIFTKEATIVRKSLIREETFSPRFGTPSEVLLGFDGLPALDGYVIVSIKDLATEALMTEFDDPLLAHWRYGLGKTMAFTSDAKDKWASNWVQWGSFSKFWAQMVRWSLRETNSPNYEVNTEIEGGTGTVVVDAIDTDGNFLNFREFETTVIGPDFEPQTVTVSQVAPGRYEGNFAASKVGTYMVSMATESDGQTQFLTSGVSLSYSPEYETSRSSLEQLRRIAESSGGKFVSDKKTYNPYLRDLVPTKRPFQLWPWLLLAGILLVPVDVFFRRVYVNWSDVGGWVAARFLGLVPKKKADGHDTRMENLRAAKDRALRDKEDEKAERETRAAFRDKYQQDKPAGGDESVFDKQDAGPAIKSEKQTFSAEEKEARPQGQTGMSSLLEAKKRAQEKRRKK